MNSREALSNPKESFNDARNFSLTKNSLNKIGSLKNKLSLRKSSELVEQVPSSDQKQQIQSANAKLGEEKVHGTPNKTNISFINSVFKDSVPLDISCSYEIIEEPGESVVSEMKSFKIKNIVKHSRMPQLTADDKNKIKRKQKKEQENESESTIQQYFKLGSMVDSPVVYPKTSCIKAVSYFTFINKKGTNEDSVQVVCDYQIKNKSLNYFAIFDGHNGSRLSKNCKNEMHETIFVEYSKSQNLVNSLQKAILKTETSSFAFNAEHSTGMPLDPSGTCALTCLVEDREVAISWVGDSRAIASMHDGNAYIQLTTDHKADCERERKRITKAGGFVLSSEKEPGCFRVYPGSLTVSRAIGDFAAKYKKFGGNSKAVIANPDSVRFVMNKDWDFLVLGSSLLTR